MTSKYAVLIQEFAIISVGLSPFEALENAASLDLELLEIQPLGSSNERYFIVHVTESLFRDIKKHGPATSFELIKPGLYGIPQENAFSCDPDQFNTINIEDLPF